MVSGIHKSRTYKRTKVRTPGGKVVMHYGKRLPQKPQCGVCGQQLHGIPQARPYVMRNLAKTKKRPERPYGGVLCSKCMRLKLLEKIE